MLRFAAFCLTVTVVTLILVDVCGVRAEDITSSGLARQVRSAVSKVTH